MRAFAKQMKLKEQKSSLVPTASSYASLFPFTKPKIDMGREHQHFTFPLTMLYDDDDLPAPPSGFIDPPQLFPIVRQQNSQNAHLVDVQ